MTIEELQQLIIQILSIQRSLQDSQLKLTEDVGNLTEDIGSLKEGIVSFKEDVTRLAQIISRLTDNLSRLTDNVFVVNNNVSTLTDQLVKLIGHSELQDRRMEQLIEYNINYYAERKDLEERITILENKLKELES